MVKGRTISIYLPEGNPKGIKKCQIRESIGRAILIPRNELDKIKKIQELNQQGIYFLVDITEKEETSFYVGEAEELSKRVLQHDKADEDWNYAICFYSATNNINKAHVRYLESICYTKLKELGRENLINGNNPQRPRISEEEENLLEGFFEEIKILMGVLGYPIFEEIKKAQKEEDIFYCKGKDAEAKGNLTEEGFVVYKDSKARLEDVPSLNYAIKEYKEALKRNNVLKESQGELVFDEDLLMSSPSNAAAVVLGRPANGWIEWKNKEGKTLDELKRQKVENDN